jgi:hypothetical protein
MDYKPLHIIFDYDGILSRGQFKDDQASYEDRVYDLMVEIYHKYDLEYIHCLSTNLKVHEHIHRMGLDWAFWDVRYAGDSSHKAVIISDMIEYFDKEYNGIHHNGIHQWVFIDDNSYNNPDHPRVKFIHMPYGLFTENAYLSEVFKANPWYMYV